jgi:hypothetical protein
MVATSFGNKRLVVWLDVLCSMYGAEEVEREVELFYREKSIIVFSSVFLSRRPLTNSPHFQGGVPASWRGRGLIDRKST